MGSLQAEAEMQNDLNDSGLGQDESLTMKKQVLLEPENTIQLLDLSDDVLLYILKHCSPRDLKALGFTCARLGNLVLDRTLWERVDAREYPVGMNRLSWLMKYAISASTSELLLSGYAKQVEGCLGRMSCRYENDYEPFALPFDDEEGSDPSKGEAGANTGEASAGGVNTGEASAGGVNTGEASAGGVNTGEASAGGVNTGEASAGGVNTGEASAGGANTGEASAGGVNTEEANAGGVNTGEASAGAVSARGASAGEPSIDIVSARAACIRAARAREPNFGAIGIGRAERHVPGEPIRRGIIRGGPVVQIYESMPRLEPYIPNGPLIVQQFPRKINRPLPSDDSCPGPLFTVTNDVMLRIGLQCPNLTSLALEYCNLDCETTSIQKFPKTLKVLSLRGSKCYTQTYDKSFLFKIQDCLKLLEELNVSDCEWVEPSSLLPLSKLPALRRLYMRNCCKMCECVAYSSLSTRYGFSSLQVLDLRESPVGDSEISSFGWVASLEELYVSPAPEKKHRPKHGHYVGDKLPAHCEMEPWEEQEPEYMDKLSKTRAFIEDEPAEDRDDDTLNLLKRKRISYPCGSFLDALESANNHQRLPSFDPPDESDASDAKRSRQNGVNEGASTSKTTENPDAPSTSNDGPSAPTAKNSNGNASGNLNGNANENPNGNAMWNPNRDVNWDPFGNMPSPDWNPFVVERNENTIRSLGPAQKVLYVNVCRKLHAMYRLSMPVYAIEEPADMSENRARLLNVSSEPFAMSSRRFNPATLVSDASVHRFGRADTDNVNYINIWPNGIQRDHTMTRPDRSNLRILYMRGFRNITNRSLVHLATAAPRLTLVDFTGTRVNERGVENFKSLRPDCEVLYTKIEGRKET